MFTIKLQKETFQSSLEYACKVLNQSPVKNDIIDVILYGSTARKEETFHSDIDLLFIVDKIDQSNKREIIYLKGNLSPTSVYAPQIDAKFITKETWRQDNSSYYLQKVRKDGISIWQKENT